MLVLNIVLVLIAIGLTLQLVAQTGESPYICHCACIKHCACINCYRANSTASSSNCLESLLTSVIVLVLNIVLVLIAIWLSLGLVAQTGESALHLSLCLY